MLNNKTLLAIDKIKTLKNEEEEIVDKVMGIYDSIAAKYSKDQLNNDINLRHKVIDELETKLLNEYGSDTNLYTSTGLRKSGIVKMLERLRIEHGEYRFNTDIVKAAIRGEVNQYHTNPLKQNALFEITRTDTPKTKKENIAGYEQMSGLKVKDYDLITSQDLESLVSNRIDEIVKMSGNAYFAKPEMLKYADVKSGAADDFYMKKAA